MTDGSDLFFLPQEIQQILKRKSSRDPCSRFEAKLHILLSFVHNSGDNEMEDKVGCGWVNEDEFRLNKKVITNVLNIKLNTLNVNLHALGFKQLKHNKDGWTLWKKEGFNITSSGLPKGLEIIPSNGYVTIQNSMSGIGIPSAIGMPGMIPPPFIVRLGQSNNNIIMEFMARARKIWRELGNMDERPAHTDSFMNSAASRFKQEEQPHQNAIDVLKAIIAPIEMQTTVTFPQFCNFLAMFGPEGSIMLKIASLLQCSNNSGQWLSFSKLEQNSGLRFYGAFDENEPNCLLLVNNGHTTTKVWNLPLVDASGNYVCDENGHLYGSWDDYFNVNPIRSVDPYPY